MTKPNRYEIWHDETATTIPDTLWEVLWDNETLCHESLLEWELGDTGIMVYSCTLTAEG